MQTTLKLARQQIGRVHESLRKEAERHSTKRSDKRLDVLAAAFINIGRVIDALDGARKQTVRA